MRDLEDIYARELRRRGSLSRTSRVKYCTIVAAYLASLEGAEPTKERALDWIADLKDRGYADKSYEFYAHVVGNFHRTVLREELELKVRRAKTLPPYFPWASVERILAQAERGLPRARSPEHRERNHDACAFLAFTGCRSGELQALRRRDVDFDGELIHVRGGKGNKDRALPMHERAVLPLRRACKGKSASARVFDSFGARKLYDMVTRLAAAAGVDAFSPHAFRHAFCTELVARNVPLDRVQRLMGHENLDSTARYLGLNASHLREAIDVLGGGTVPVVEEEEERSHLL